MALDNFNLGIKSVTYVPGKDGKPVEVDPVDWTRDDYFTNLQGEPSTPSLEPPTAAPAKRKRKSPSVSKEKPKMVGEDVLEKAHQKDLKRRGLK